MPGSPLVLGVPFILGPRLQPLAPRPDIKEHPPLRAFLYTKCPMHSCSLITIPPNRLHTSLRHRSQILEGPVLRPFSYTKCPMHSYSLITILPNMLQILSEVLMSGPIQFQTIWRIPLLFSKMPYVSFSCDTQWVPIRFPPSF
jgi:hypothetical protein